MASNYSAALNSMTSDELRKRADANSAAWHGYAGDTAAQNALHDENVAIRSILDSRTGDTSTFDSRTGRWYTTPTQTSDWTQRLLDTNNSYSAALERQQAAQQAAVKKAVNSLEAQKTDTNNAYSDYYRQAYLNKMNAQKNINQRMAAQGVTGGAAESTLLGLNNSYSDALRSMEQSRIRDLEDIDRAITDAQMTGDVEAANTEANAIREQTASYADVLKYLQNRQDALNAQETATGREDAAAARSWAQQRALTALQNGVLPDSETLEKADMTSSYAAALLDALNRQRAQEQADWRAGYGDYSGLQSLGVDTSRLSTQQSTGVSRYVTSGASTPKYTKEQAQAAIGAAINGDYSAADIAEAYYGMPMQTILAAYGVEAPQTARTTQNPGIPQRYLDEINDDAEGGMSIANLAAKLERWVRENRLTAEQADWLAASFGF